MELVKHKSNLSRIFLNTTNLKMLNDLNKLLKVKDAVFAKR